MDAKVDYLSFTLPLNLSGAGHSEEAYNAISQRLEAAGFCSLLAILAGEQGGIRNGRRIYGAGLYYEGLHISIWFGGIANHVLVEIAGVGCQLLRERGCLSETLASAQGRATRLDVAVDLPDAGKPDEFVLKRKGQRFTARASFVQETGWTEYVGSMKSSRFACVYLYADPHPRAGVLRVEHRLRDDYAKEACKEIVSSGLPHVVALLGNSFGWEHPRWQPEKVTEGKLSIKRHDSDGAGTLRWLANAVAPALARAHKEGLLDAEDWFFTHVQPLIEAQSEGVLIHAVATA